MELYKLLETFNGFLWCPVMLVLLVAVLLIVNLIWKFSLMNAEKRLIEEGRGAVK